MNFRNLIWVVAIVAIFAGAVGAQDKPLDKDKQPLDKQPLDKQPLDKQPLDNQQGVTTVTGTVYCTFDEQGNAKSCEIRDMKGTSFSIHTEGMGKDFMCMPQARIRATGRMVDREGKKVFEVQGYEATLGIAGKLMQKEQNQLVLQEINFQENPKSFKVTNRKEEIEKLGIPFDKEIKANGTIIKGRMVGGEGQQFKEGEKFPKEGYRPEDKGNLPKDEYRPEDKGNLPKDDKTLPRDDKSKPEDNTLPRDDKSKPEDQRLPKDRQPMERDQQAGLDKQAADWTIRISSYEPLEHVVGVVSAEKGTAGAQIKLEEEEKGIIFKEKGRTFEVSNEGKGVQLRQHDGQKVKVYGTVSKNQQGNWLLHVLAYHKEGAAEKE
jgi:hypothetical protein